MKLETYLDLKKMKHLFTLFLVLFPISLYADDKGICGDGLTYIYSEISATLTISKTGNGSGKMSDYDNKTNHAPWYTYASSIITVRIEQGVVSIGNYAFFELSSLTSISLPDGVITIGRQSFRNCTNLKSINLPSSIQNLMYGAFAYCSSLESLDIPENVKEISEYLLYQCKKIESVKIPNSVINIGDRAFYRCEQLKTIQLPDERRILQSE